MNFNFSDFADIYRLTDADDKESRVQVHSDIPGFLKPASAEVALINQLQASQAFSFFNKYYDDYIQIGDELVVDSVSYIVRGIKINPTSAGYNSYTLERPVKS